MRLRERIYLAWLLFPPATWLWNIRHRKLIEETRKLMNFRWFLVHDCGFRWVEKIPVSELKEAMHKMKKSSII
jgi:hypothetical protein